ncbi:type IV secretion system DNA-binding domain-containing protein [bacterium]|nr:type IV secretion system DNA-binding domain-containing protein [bacterium]NCQ55259.1 type IV secretion system DNA-binding domain-containing protein [Candidatus Parcubacteria bacterium]NCS67228.1 type IV secretion system DNA-binding domain-containing protein [Candidatus Peregrinibacteria bacterium]NCS96483.1 type IV secretion system DNA-binding domain-containing protein [bacterium]
MDFVFLLKLGVTVAILVAVGLVYLAFLRKKNNSNRSLDFIFLSVTIPKKDSKDDFERDRDQTSEIRKVVSVGEDLLASLQGIYSSDLGRWWKGQDFLSLEYIAVDGQIHFYVGCPRDIKDLVEKQITSFYSEAIVDETDAPQVFKDKTQQAAVHLSGSSEFAYPFKGYTKFENTDPINNVLNALSQASDEQGNSAIIQFMVRPATSNWQSKVRAQAKDLGSGKTKIAWWNPLVLLGGFFSVMFRGASDEKSGDDGKDSNESQEMTKAMEEKSEKFGFETIIRCATSSTDARMAKTNLTNIVTSFAQYGTPTLNNFKTTKHTSPRRLIRNIVWRSFDAPLARHNKLLLSTEELASLFHFPHIKYNNVPSVKWQNYKIVQAPNNIPKEGLLLGHNTYRGRTVPIYMKRDDRFRHFYVIGQTGTGKSSIFQTMIRQDMQNGDGLCVVDPHGSLVEDLLPFVPKERVDDVIIFDPSDLERPMGLNLLEAETEEERDMVAMDAMNMMIKLFDEETFGPRIQDYFRNGVLTLMADPNGGAITDIMRLFTDDAFQRTKVKHLTNPVVKSFWTNQMAKTGAREKQEIIPYFAAKFGQFYTNGMIRNIIGQTKSSFNFSDVMDSKKILFMNLSKGMTGDFNSKLLGLIIVSKIQTAALRRQKQTKGARTDFFLYIDEFQNYVTDSIESILSEARKYRLSLNVAHQYMSQIDTSGQKKGVNLKDAILGNVGTMMCYKIGAQDAEVMAKEMAPTFTDQDLVNVDKYKAVMKLSIDTQPSKPFSITPANPYLEAGNPDMATALKQISRLTHGRSKKFVEKEIFARLDV